MVRMRDSSCPKVASQCTVACAEFENPMTLPKPPRVGTQGALEPEIIAHKMVDHCQLPPAINGARISVWEGVENFRYNDADKRHTQRQFQSVQGAQRLCEPADGLCAV